MSRSKDESWKVSSEDYKDWGYQMCACNHRRGLHRDTAYELGHGACTRACHWERFTWVPFGFGDLTAGFYAGIQNTGGRSQVKRKHERMKKGKYDPEHPYDLLKADPKRYPYLNAQIKSIYCHAEWEFDKITVYGMKENEYLLMRCSDNEFLVGDLIEGNYDARTRQMTMWYPSVTEQEEKAKVLRDKPRRRRSTIGSNTKPKAADGHEGMKEKDWKAARPGSFSRTQFVSSSGKVLPLLTHPRSLQPTNPIRRRIA